MVHATTTFMEVLPIIIVPDISLKLGDVPLLVPPFEYQHSISNREPL